MKVCMVATDFPVKREGASVTYGGAGACMAQLVRGLTGVGVEVTLVTRKEKGEYSEIFNVPVYRTPYMDFGLRESKITHAATVLPTLLKVVRNEKFDVIHSHNPPASLPAIVASKRYGIPHVTTMHGPWADVRLSRLGRFFCRIIEKRALKHADQVTCDSKKLAEDVTVKYGLDERKVSAIQNAVEINQFNPKLASKKDAREKLGIATEDKLVLYTGRFLVEKGITYLLDAVEEVLDKKKKVSFLFVGGGFDEHIVSERLSKKKMTDELTVIPYVPYEKMPYAYLASDLLVQPSLAEGLSRSILEAMACGLPIAATDVGGNPELVSERNGVLFKPKSSHEIAKAIVDLLSDEEKLARMGCESRKVVVSEFSVEKRVESFIKLYKRMC